jgi:TIR domain
MSATTHSVFISHASADAKVARSLTEGLERSGIRCWIAPRDVMPGRPWGDSIVAAIEASKAVILILSSSSNSSAQVAREVELASSRGIRLIPYRIDHVTPSRSLEFFLGHLQWFDGSGADQERHASKLAGALRQLLPDTFPVQAGIPDATVEREDRSRGYVFISYARSDADFVQRLRKVFETKKYGYWDYVVGARDYHGTLYRELEERIDGAVAFMTVVSDDWRNSDWVASEFIYAREVRIPIFVIQAKRLTRPLPILLNLQTRIDMSGDFDSGAQILVQELSNKGL